MTDKLKDFLTDLATNEELRGAFKSDKSATMKKHGIPDSDIQLVITKNYTEIQKRLGADYEISKNAIIDAFKLKN